MLAFRPIALFFALIALSSCAYNPENSVFTGGRCTAAYGEYLQGVDWKQAKKLNLRIRQGDFLPVYMGLLQDQSYVLTIENADDIGHTFRAMEFFQAVAVAGVRIDGGKFEKISCLKGVSIPAGKITEIRLIAVRDGSYEFEDNSLMFSLAMVGSAGGFITIEPPRELPLSPLDHLKLFERKPIEDTRQESKPTGLFDDQEEEPAPSPGGLFDDQETPSSDPPSGLFDDDPAPEQPIDASPSVPVESLFEDPTLQPEPDQPAAPADSVDSMFEDPSLQIPDTAPDMPVVSAPVQEPSEPAPLDFGTDMDTDTDDIPLLMEDEPVVDPTPEKTDGAPLDDEEEMFVEELLPETPTDTTPSQPQAPLALPDGYEPILGPPADIYSDPPDVVITDPGSGGAAGEDQFDGSG
jgi:hypothetical protein